MSSIIKKIPGFRSGKLWKKIVALIGYFFILFIILVIVIPSAPTLAVNPLEPTNKKSVLVTGETSDNKPVYLFKEGEQVKETTADSDGKFSFALNNLADGKHSFLVKACNKEEQEHCESKNISFKIDTTPPEKPTIALPKELPEIEDGKVVIKGKTEPNAEVEIAVGDNRKKTKSDENGEYEVKTGLVLGANTVKVKAKDQLGNESESVEEIKFQPNKVKAKVKRVIDGDTVELENGEKLRYIGIDTPETHNADECYGEEATSKNKELVEGKKVYLEKDVSETDQYGRLLRYVWINGEMINEKLVKQGYAKASTYPPDVKYQDKFRNAEKEAREKEKGLWGEVCQPKEVKEKESKQTKTTEAVQGTSTVQQLQPVEEQKEVQTGPTCNCSKTCSQMASCEEAYFQLNQCGCSQRDGDSDGVPCESICSGGTQTTQQTTETVSPLQTDTSTSGSYTCSCSKTCGEMASCDEAYYQLNQCGCSRRDGDNDGVPCESICE
jgi:micrococcal nuclease